MKERPDKFQQASYHFGCSVCFYLIGRQSRADKEGFVVSNRDRDKGREKYS